MCVCVRVPELAALVGRGQRYCSIAYSVEDSSSQQRIIWLNTSIALSLSNPVLKELTFQPVNLDYKEIKVLMYIIKNMLIGIMQFRTFQEKW